VPSKSVLYVTAALVLAALLIDSVIRGHSPEGVAEWLAPIGPGVSCAIVGLVIFDRWAWRQPGIQRLTGRPVLRGTWFGEVASTWEDPQTGKRIDPDPSVFLVIRQNFWSISARLLTNESRSRSIHAALRADEDGVCRLLYVYENHPEDDVKHKSQSHFGTAILSAPRNRQDGVVGGYFTGRKTTGDMRFHQHFPEFVESYEAGLKLPS
jgi:hypothetical protein